MAFLMYPGLPGSGNIPCVNALTGAEYTGAFAEYEIKLGVLVGGIAGKVRVGTSKFGVALPTQDECDAAAYEYALALAKASAGVIMGISKKLGKYRNDELPGNIESGQTSYGVIYLTNGKTSAEDMTPDPHKLIKEQIYVPFTDLTEFAQIVNDITTQNITFGSSRFTDDNKGEMSISIIPNLAGKKLLDMNMVKSFGLVSMDTVEGVSDGVLSEVMG